MGRSAFSEGYGDEDGAFMTEDRGLWIEVCKWRMKDGGWRMEEIHTHATHGEVSEDGLLAVHGGHQDDFFCMILTFYA